MDVFSNLMVIGECLLDARRTRAFEHAIKQTVKPGDVVADIGTGSGILAMMSARAGAKKVYAVDIASDIAHFAKKNVRNNNLDSIVSVSHADAKKGFATPKPVDVVTMELMDTWLIAEQQAIVLNQLRKNRVIDGHTRLIPYRYQCALALVEYDFSFYGFTMPFVIQARNFGVIKRISSTLSPTIIFKDIDLGNPISTHVDETIEIPINKNGTCNALVLRAKTLLAPGIAAWGTTDMNMPVIIPMPPRHIHKGESLKLHIRFAMGEGFKTFEAKWV